MLHVRRRQQQQQKVTEQIQTLGATDIFPFFLISLFYFDLPFSGFLNVSLFGMGFYVFK